MLRFISDRRRASSGWLGGLLLTATLFAAPGALHAQSTRLNGDVNNDNTVDQVDAQAVLKGIIDVALPAGQDLTYGDANCDGRVTALDAQIILMKAASINVATLCVGRQVGAPVAAITVDPATGSVVAAGNALQLTATPLDPSNTALTFKTIIWTSSDVSRATVSNTGLVQGVAAGTVLITAANGSVNTIIPITVVPAGPITLTISPSAALTTVGRTAPLSLELRDAANNIVADRAIVWKSSDPKIAAISPTTGLVTGVAAGTVTITADAGNGVIGTSSVTVASLGTTTTSWTGATSTDWNTATNWSKGAVPTPVDTVEIQKTTAIVNQPVLASNVIIAGVKLKPTATLSIGANELQITGVIDVDGQITGAGRVNAQGLNGSKTLVRGTLPNLTITGETELVDDLAVTGSLEINTVSTLRLKGRKLNVAQNLAVRGGIYMAERTDTLDVRGNARFFNDAGMNNAPLRPIWTTGTFRLGGNLVVYSPFKTGVSPLQTSGTNRIILNGASPQVLADTGVTLVPLQDLDIATSSVEFKSFAWNSEPDSGRFRFSGRVVGTIATTIKGDARVNALNGIFTAGGSVILRNLAVRGLIVAAGVFSPDTLTLLGPAPTTPSPQAIPSAATYQYKELVIAGVDKFTSATGVGGGMTLGCLTTLSDCVVGAAQLTIGGNTVTVEGNLRQTPLQTTTRMIMDSVSDNVLVKGGLLGPVGTTVGTTPSPISLPVEFTVSGTEWNKGLLRVRGDVAVTGPGAPVGTHTFIMEGSASQALRANTGFSFNELQIQNTSTAGVVSNDTTQAIRTTFGRFRTANVRKNLTIGTATKLTGTGKFTVQGDVQTAPGSTVDLLWISIGSVQRVSGTWAPDTTEYASGAIAQTVQSLSGYKHVRVSGKASFGGNVTIANGLHVLQNGELGLERRSVFVTGTTTITGILRMQDPKDTLTIDGNVNFDRVTADLPTQTLVTAGVLKVSGDIIGAKAGGFYPTGTHKTIWNTGNVTQVKGDYNNFEVATKILGTTGAPFLRNVNIRGSLTANAGLAKLTIDTLTVVGASDLTQADTVFVNSSLAKVDFQGPLKLRKMKILPVNRVTAKNVEIIDAGALNGQIVYSGTYTEAPTVTNPELNTSYLAGLISIFWTTQPSTVKVNTAISPAPVLELRDSANKLLVGTQYITISATTGNVNGAASIRVRFDNGTLTLGSVQLSATGTQQLAAKVILSTGLNTFMSNPFAVNP